MKPNLLFDLDGTLSDPFTGFANSIHEAFATLGRDAPSDAALRCAIGPPIEAGMAELLGTSDASTVSEAIRLYRKRYGEIGLYENHLYPGIADALSELKRRGSRLFLATSKPLVFAARIVDHFGLRPLFDGLYGSELDGRHSDKSQLIAHLLQTERLTPNSCCMVGDRLHDVVGALGNGITPLAVLWGYGSREELLAAGALHLCGEPSELVRSLASIE